MRVMGTLWGPAAGRLLARVILAAEGRAMVLTSVRPLVSRRRPAVSRSLVSSTPMQAGVGPGPGVTVRSYVETVSVVTVTLRRLNGASRSTALLNFRAELSISRG